MEQKNPFSVEGEAARYHQFRPHYHHLPFSRILEIAPGPFDSALDVACGTGHSTSALAKISKEVIGCDLSETMLVQARQNSNLEFVRAPAENLPFVDNSFDFVNISMAFHWVDQEKFLREAKRVLIPSGYLSVDCYGFSGALPHGEFLKAYLPPASRRANYPTEDQIAVAGFTLFQEIPYEHVIPMAAEAFIQFMMTWSNFQVLTENRKSQVAQKMNEFYPKIFAGGTLDLNFSGKAQLYAQ